MSNFSNIILLLIFTPIIHFSLSNICLVRLRFSYGDLINKISRTEFSLVFIFDLHDFLDFGGRMR